MYHRRPTGQPAWRAYGTGIGLALGAGVGMALGTVVGEPALGLSLGAAAGLVVGAVVTAHGNGKQGAGLKGPQPVP